MHSNLDLSAWTVAKTGGRIAAATVALVLLSAGSHAQFQAVPNLDGNVVILDTNGTEVAVAPAEPVGIRPMDCPSGAYYVSEVPTDKTELVLTDCATSQSQYTVDMQGQTD